MFSLARRSERAPLLNMFKFVIQEASPSGIIQVGNGCFDARRGHRGGGGGFGPEKWRESGWCKVVGTQKYIDTSKFLILEK